MAKKKSVRRPPPLTRAERKTLSGILVKARAHKAFLNANPAAAKPAGKSRGK